jgi:hypothetical protein
MKKMDFIRNLSKKTVVQESLSYEDALLARLEQQANKLQEAENPVDVVTLDIPLLIRIMEYAREDAKTDMDLHNVTERMIALSKSSQTLSMHDYDHIVGQHTTEEPAKTDENIDMKMIKMLAGIKNK